MTPDLAITLDAVARAAALLRSDWWIIGSAAAALAGTTETPADVDVLCADQADARRLREAMGGDELPVGGSELFRSTFLARVSATPLPIEIMAGFEVSAADGWAPVRPRTRVATRGLFIPDAAEQAEICRLFGRPKDLARAERLDALAR